MMYEMSPFETWSFIVLLFVTILAWFYWVQLSHSQKREETRTKLAWQNLARKEYALQQRLQAYKALPVPDLYDQEKEEHRAQYVGALVLTGYSREVANAEFERLWTTLTTRN